MARIQFDPSKHPRDAAGQFRKVLQRLAKADALDPTKEVETPAGIVKFDRKAARRGSMQRYYMRDNPSQRMTRSDVEASVLSKDQRRAGKSELRSRMAAAGSDVKLTPREKARSDRIRLGIREDANRPNGGKMNSLDRVNMAEYAEQRLAVIAEAVGLENMLAMAEAHLTEAWSDAARKAAALARRNKGYQGGYNPDNRPSPPAKPRPARASIHSGSSRDHEAERNAESAAIAKRKGRSPEEQAAAEKAAEAKREAYVEAGKRAASTAREKAQKDEDRQFSKPRIPRGARGKLKEVELAEEIARLIVLIEMADIPRHRDGKWTNTLARTTKNSRGVAAMMSELAAAGHAGGGKKRQGKQSPRPT